MDVKFDFSDVDGFFEQGYAEVKAVEDKVGKEAVDYAVKNGSYKNPEYASFVESKGYEVLSGAALYAEKRLKEEIK